MEDDRESTDWKEEIAKAVVSSYYPDRIRAGATARQNVQSTYAVVSAVAGVGIVLIANGQGSGLNSIASIISIAMWFLASFAFASALSGVGLEGSNLPAKGPDGFVKAVLETAKEEADAVRQANMIGILLALVAAVFSLVVLWGIEAEGARVRIVNTPATVFLNDVAAEEVEEVCGSGSLDVVAAHLIGPSQDFFELTLDAGCEQSIVVLNAELVEALVVE